MDDLKRLIRSILISSPLETEIWKLDKDYDEINGERIPFRTFGFNSLEELLRSIPDVVFVHGTGSKALLKVVVSSKTAHIDKLISKQRCDVRKRSRKTGRPAPPRRSSSFHRQALLPTPVYPSYPMPYRMQLQPPTVVASYYIQTPKQNFPSYPSPLHSNYEIPPRFNPSIRRDLPPPGGYRYYSIEPRRDVPPRPNHTSVPSKLSPVAVSTPLLVRNSPSPSPLLNTPDLSTPKNQTAKLSPVASFQKESPVITNGSNTPSVPSKSPITNGQSSTGAIPKQNINLSPQNSPTKSPEVECYYSDQDGYLSDGDDTEECRNLTPEEEYINYNVPFAVQENLKKLMSQHEEGVWCGEMPKIYLKMFKKRLDYAEYGYRSLIQMCMALEKIFHCHRPDSGDFLLFDKTKPMPRNLLRNLQNVSSFKTKLNCDTEDVATEPAIIDAEELIRDILPDCYPPDVMQLGDEIPRQFLHDSVKEQDYIDVVVGEVYDPSKFWILLQEYSANLDSLMDEMQSYYTSLTGNLLEIPDHMIKIGLYCAATYNNEYHRAIIVNNAFDKAKIKVFYADYGTLATINRKGLLFLHKNFMKLPLQAIRARLASIWPTISSSPWSVDASSRFLNLVKHKNLVAHVFRIIRDKQMVEIFLADTSTAADIYMNDTLVYEGFALFTNQEQEKRSLHPCRIPKYKHMHLFPSFEDLEWGNALNAAEVVRLCRAGFQEEYLFPNYYTNVENEESKVNDEQFVESQNKQLLLIEQLKNENYIDSEFKTNTGGATSSTSLNASAVPNPDWTELCKEEEEEIANNEKYIGEVNLSSMSEEPSTTPESPFTPGRQIFATPVVKPPPGFEGVQPNFNFNTESINVSNVGNPPAMNMGSNNTDNLLLMANCANIAAQSMATTMLPAPMLRTTQPVNFMTQQVVDPILFMQNAKQKELIQQAALSRILNSQAVQTNVPNNSWNQQQYQNMLINQQNPLLIAQQQNPFVFPQQTPVLFPQQQVSWNNPNHAMFQQTNPFANQTVPGSHCLPAELRQQLQKFVHKHLMTGNISLLNYLGSILSCQNDRKEGLLYKIVCEVMLNRSTTVLFNELEIIVNDLLDLLLDCQIIDLANKQLGITEGGNSVTTPNTSCNNSVNDVLVKLMSQTSIGSQVPLMNTTQSFNRVKNDKDVEVQTDVELENNQNESRTKHVIKTALENQPIHVIRFKDSLYVPVNDILPFTIVKPPIDVIRKLIVMTDPMSSIMDIRLNEHRELAEELSRYKISDSTIHVVPVKSIPNMIRILGGKEHLFNNYNDFLETINVNSDLWSIR